MPSPNTYNCCICKKKQPGRFTRPKDSASGQWVKGTVKPLPAWYCYTCLAAGDGKEESAVTRAQQKAKKTAAVVQVAAETQPERKEEARSEGLQVLRAFEAEALEKLEDAEDFAFADAQLGRVRQFRKQWGERMERIIRPIRQGLDELYGLNREIDKPAEKLELVLKKQMGDYKLAEQRQIEAEQRERDEVARKLREASEEAERKAKAASTPQIRARFEHKAMDLAVEAAQVETAESDTVAAVSMNSSSRKVSKWRVTDMDAFVKGIVDGYIPVACVVVNKTETDIEFKIDREAFELWPGVQVYEEMEVRGR